MSEERAAWLRLLRTPRLGSVGLLQGLERFGNAAAWVASAERPKALLSAPAEIDCRWLERPQRSLLTWNDPDYPALLRQIPDPPAALWIAGEPSALWLPQLAIVGSRNASAGGLALAGDFASTLARSGLAITSGLALGIDVDQQHVLAGQRQAGSQVDGGRRLADAAFGQSNGNFPHGLLLW